VARGIETQLYDQQASFSCQHTQLVVFIWFGKLSQGSHASWKVLDFFKYSRTWKVLENQFGPGKSWKLKFKVLESPGKIVATGCHISRLKCTKFDFGWASAPDPALGELTVLPQIP